MHLAVFLLLHSSQGCHLLQIPASLSTSSPEAPPVMIRRFRNTGTSSCDTLGRSANLVFPSQGRSFFVQAHSRTCSNRLLGITTFTPGDRSTWHPGDAVSYPAASHLQRTSRNGFFTFICVGLQHLHETLGRGLPKLGFRLPNEYFSRMLKCIRLCLQSETLCSVKSALLKASNPTILQKVYEAKPGFGVVPRQKQYFQQISNGQ